MPQSKVHTTVSNILKEISRRNKRQIIILLLNWINRHEKVHWAINNNLETIINTKKM